MGTKTGDYVGALRVAIQQSGASLHDQHYADESINELLLQALKRRFYTTDRQYAVDMQLAGHTVIRKWNWFEFRRVWWIIPKYSKK